MNKSLLIISIFNIFVRSKGKSFLMMLGVIIGVLSLVSSITVGNGLKISILRNLNNSFLPNNIGLVSRASNANDRVLTLTDISVINNSVAGIAAWTPLIFGGRKNAKVGGRNHDSRLTGVDVSAEIVMGQPTIEGEYFSLLDMQRLNKVVLLGQTVTQNLFADQMPIGQQIEIDNQLFTVKGVLKGLGSDPHGGDLDNVILLPYTTLMQMSKQQQLGSVRFMVDEPGSSDRIANDMVTIMRQQHNIREGESNDFLISTSPRGIEMVANIESIFKLVIPVVVAIIFIISALVISIVMQISIKQRRAEIGLRKALGARPIDLENQFLLETCLLTLLAALIGVLLSYALMELFERFYQTMGGELSLQPSGLVVVVSLLCSVLVGLFAGYIPARKAALLIPVEALR